MKPAFCFAICASYLAVCSAAVAQVGWPPDIGAGSTANPGTQPVAQGPNRPPLAGSGAFRIEHDIEYSRVDGRVLHLDLYLRNAPDGAPLPVVVWLHGGGSVGGGKTPSPAARLVADGYAVASIEYRPAREAHSPAQVYDAKAAVRWLRANAAKYNLDVDHIGAWGASVGGNLAAMLGVTGGHKLLEGDEGNQDQSSSVQAVVDFYGPVDLTRLDPKATKPDPYRPDLPEAILLGGPVLQNIDSAKAANPISYITPEAPPFLIVHGTADMFIPARQSEFLEVALKHAGVEVDLEYVPGAKHSIEDVETPAIAEVVTTFFDKHLRGGKHQRDDIALITEPPDSWIDPFSDEQPGTIYQLYDTPSRGVRTQASYRIYLPPGYDLLQNAGHRYPVIYYLHGFRDDSRKAVTGGYIPRLDVAVRTGLMPATIVVVLQAPNAAGYVDWSDGKTPVESVFIKDLIPHIDRIYRTVATRGGRAIEGHSMGGSGAMHMAFKYPELFGSMSSLSAAVVDMTDDPDILRTRYGGDAARDQAETAWALAMKNADTIRGHMSIRMIVGDKDELITRNEWMSKLLDDLHLTHTFIISKGAPHALNEVLAHLDDNPFAYYENVFGPFE